MLVHSYAAVFRHFWTLEDTLVGYLFNDLIWCGQEEDSGEQFYFCNTEQILKSSFWGLLVMCFGVYEDFTMLQSQLKAFYSNFLP